jgi:hypothetical protein
MPRGEAEEIFKLIKPIGIRSLTAVVRQYLIVGVIITALELDPKLFIEIMGSFRRRV